MSETLQINPQEITVRAMCLIMRSDNGDLNVDYEPVPYDSRISKELKTISGEMQEWDRSRAESIWKQYSNESPFKTHFLNKHENPAERLLREYDQLHMQINNKPCLNLIPQGPHAMWLSHDSISYIAAQEGPLRQSSLQKSAIEKKLATLNPSEADKLNSAFNRAVILRKLLIKYLDEYDAKYAEYIQTVEALVPNVFSRKKYCRDFSGAYGSSELDYDMTPGNQCVIDNLHEYYLASLLEMTYSHYDTRPDVIAYSSRKLGWTSFQIDLSVSDDLEIELKTNFGYGRSSYFLSTLRYKGIGAINAPLIIFYNAAQKFELTGYTNIYELNPSSYKQCFTDAVGYWNELNNIGEAAFVEKYFAQSLIELRDLLHMVSHTSTIFQFTNLDRFNELTSIGNNNHPLHDNLNPTDAYRLPEAVKLSRADEQLLERFADSITRKKQGSKLCFDSNLQSVIKGTFNPDNTDNDSISLIRIGLAHQKLFSLLNNRPIQSTDIGLLIKDTIPYPGYFIQHYSGFELIQFRMKKAGIALVLFGKLKSIASLTNLENVINDLFEICQEIKQQAVDYTNSSIVPSLSKCQHEKQDLDTKLAEIRKLAEDPAIIGTELNWVQEQKQFLIGEIREIESEIRRLEIEKKEINAYIAKCNST